MTTSIGGPVVAAEKTGAINLKHFVDRARKVAQPRDIGPGEDDRGRECADPGDDQGCPEPDHFGQEATEDMTVTAVETGRRTEVRAESHGMRYRTEFEVLPVTGGSGGSPKTQLVMRFQGEYEQGGRAQKLLGAITVPLGVAVSKKAMRQDLQDIAAAAERRAGRSS